MPWKRVDVEQQRMEFVMRAMNGRERIATLCREFGISRPTGYLWRRRYEQSRSLASVVEQSRRPHHSPHRTEVHQQERVVARRRETGWGAKKLQVILREEDQTALSIRTIHRILDRHGLIAEDAHGPALQRFERSEPNELWQMDTKGKYPLADGECHPLSIVDDHSRYAVGLYALSALRIEQAYPCLVESFERYGVPQAMLMDRGTLWWSPSNGWALSRLSVGLIEQGIGLHYGRVAHPQTQGKVERFHRTLGAALRHRGVPQRIDQWKPALDEFRNDYNQRRPHEALGMQRPAERYRPSARAYQGQPGDWEYPEGSEVARLNTQGSLAADGNRWFVCQALAGRRVCLERFDGKLLVSYRHMYIREVDLATGITRPLVRPRNQRRAPVAMLSPTVALRAPCGDGIAENANAKV